MGFQASQLRFIFNPDRIIHFPHQYELKFEVLPESDQERVRNLAEDHQCLVVAPSHLADEPMVKELKKRGCRVVLIDN